MTTTQLSHSRFYTDKITEEAINQFKQELTIYSETEAKIAGSKKKPESLDYYVVTFIKLIATKAQPVLDLNYTRNQPVSNLAITQTERVKAKEDIAKKDVEIGDKIRLVATLTSEVDKKGSIIPPAPNKWVHQGIATTLAVIEGGLTAMTTIQAGLPFLTVVIVSMAIAVASGVGVSIGASYISNADTKQKRRLRYGIVIGIGVFVTGCIGAWRASIDEAVATTNAGLANATLDTPAFSSLIFTVVSALLFVIGLAFKVKHHVSNDDKNKLAEYAEKKQELAIAKKELADLEVEKELLDSTIREHSAEIIHQLEYAKNVEDRLLNLVEYAKSTYESTNVTHRPDGHCPDFFSKEIPWGLKFYFTTYLTNTNK